MERLTEAFVNLKWFSENRQHEFDADEFRAYESVLNELKRFRPNRATGWAGEASQEARRFIEARGLL